MRLTISDYLFFMAYYEGDIDSKIAYREWLKFDRTQRG